MWIQIYPLMAGRYEISKDYPVVKIRCQSARIACGRRGTYRQAAGACPETPATMAVRPSWTGMPPQAHASSSMRLVIICGEYPLSRSNQFSKELIAAAPKSFYDYYTMPLRGYGIITRSAVIIPILWLGRYAGAARLCFGYCQECRPCRFASINIIKR